MNKIKLVAIAGKGRYRTTTSSNERSALADQNEPLFKRAAVTETRTSSAREFI